MEVGLRVKVSNRFQVNYPLSGTIVETMESPNGLLVRVKFSVVDCWYYESDLKILKQQKRK